MIERGKAPSDGKFRVREHPILGGVDGRGTVEFTFEGRAMTAREGEMISTALFANGVHVLGRHHRDGAPLGIF